MFETVEPLHLDSPDALVTVTLEFQSRFPQHNIGKLRLSATDSPNPSRTFVPAAVRDALAKDPEGRTEAQRKELAAYYLTIAPALQAVRSELTALEKQKTQLLAAVPTCLVSVSGPPRTVHILARGNYLAPGAEVQPGLPVVLDNPQHKVKGGKPTRATQEEIMYHI